MHIPFSLLRIKSLYIFRALLVHPQEATHKRHFVYCVRVMSVGCATIALHCSWFSINWMKSASPWFHYPDILWCAVRKTLNMSLYSGLHKIRQGGVCGSFLLCCVIFHTSLRAYSCLVYGYACSNLILQTGFQTSGILLRPVNLTQF
jgi:hypothetical protein